MTERAHAPTPLISQFTAVMCKNKSFIFYVVILIRKYGHLLWWPCISPSKYIFFILLLLRRTNRLSNYAILIWSWNKSAMGVDLTFHPPSCLFLTSPTPTTGAPSFFPLVPWPDKPKFTAHGLHPPPQVINLPGWHILSTAANCTSFFSL